VAIRNLANENQLLKTGCHIDADTPNTKAGKPTRPHPINFMKGIKTESPYNKIRPSVLREKPIQTLGTLPDRLMQMLYRPAAALPPSSSSCVSGGAYELELVLTGYPFYVHTARLQYARLTSRIRSFPNGPKFKKEQVKLFVSF
jgi:hypothetical protein